MYLMVDNKDSFVWNLVRYLRLLSAQVDVRRCDHLDFAEIEQAGYQGIVLSPGPGTPEKAGRLLDLIGRFGEKIPMLGVCLGHQAIAQAFGGRIICGPRPMHGKVTPVRHDGLGVFAGLPSPMQVTRYHSLVVDPQTLPVCFNVSSMAEDGCIMGIRHRSGLLEGVQFHPEAVLTEHGLDLLRRFVERTTPAAGLAGAAAALSAVP
jgi:anthranilate synthase/aminodeoxychorismate synthase-like glutamine amidotransferase